MKVLMFSTDYWPDPGGIANHVYYLSKTLSEKGIKVTVIGGHRLQRYHPLEHSENLHEIVIRRIGPSGLRGILFIIKAWNTLKKLNLKGYNVVHVHNFFPDSLIFKLKSNHFSTNAAFVLTNHSGDVLRAEKSILRKFRLQKITYADLIISTSIELLEKSRFLSKNGKVKLEFIPNGVDVKLFSPGNPSLQALSKLNAEPDDIIILAVRRFHLKCGLQYLIKAFPDILKQHSKALLCLVGDGKERSYLENLVERLGIRDRVRFVGLVPNQQLPDLYRTAYISVLPSIYEAVSVSGLESIACGVPIVGSRTGGIPTIVRDGETGLLVSPGVSSELAQKISYLLSHSEIRERMSTQARNIAITEFSWDSVASRILDLYTAILCQKGR